MAVSSSPVLTSPGIGSGLDVKTLVSKLVAAEIQGPSLRLTTQEAQLQGQISALGTLKSALSDFQSSLSGLTSASTLQGMTATSSNATLFSATAGNDAVAGTYSIEVQKLAQAQKLASTAFTNTTDVVGTGTLTFRFGTYDSTGNTFTVNASKPTGSVTIDATNNSLQGIRDAVNQANIGVTATIVNDGTGNRLVFTSNDSGAANSLEVTVSNDGSGTNTDNTGLSQLAYDPTATAGTGKNLTQTIAAQDAVAVIDGLTVTNATNTVSGAIQGVTLNLLQASPGATSTVNVAADTSSVTNALQSFVSSYNKLVDQIQTLSSYDSTTQQAGPLLGDPTLLAVSTQLSNIITAAVPGANGAYRALIDLGVKTDDTGKLTLDSTKLQAALNTDFGAVTRVLGAAGQVSDPLVKFNGYTANSQVGTYDVNVTQLATQGLYNGAGVLPNFGAGGSLVVDTTNNSFGIKIDGTQSGTVTLTQGTYTSGAALAAEIQSRINGDAALKAAGASVAVSYDSTNNRLVLTSARYGSASTVEFTSVGTNTSATLGFAVGVGTAGLDVAGTIGSMAATGSGQTLTGTGPAAGLALQVLGGTIGARGTVGYSVGVTNQLTTVLNNFLGTDNIFDSRTQSLNSQITDINNQRDALSRRTDALTQQYNAQFTALDTLLSQLQTTSSFLTQQLASLPSASTKA